MKSTITKNSIYLLIAVLISFKAMGQHKNPSTLSWELQLGTSYFTNQSLVKNNAFQHPKTLSGSYTTFLEIPINKISLKTGISTSWHTFGLNKKVEVQNNKLVFLSIPANDNFVYAYLQNMYVGIPLNIMYTFPKLSNGFQYLIEAGGNINYNVYNECKYKYQPNEQNENITTLTNLKNMQPFLYGINTKLTARKARLKNKFGVAQSIGAQYSFNNIFKNNEAINTKAYQIFIGLGFYMAKTN